MIKKVYKKADTKKIKKTIRLGGLGISLLGLFFGLYVMFPILSWELYVKPAFASSTYTSPIPQKFILSKNSIKSFFETTAESISSVNFNGNPNWLPPSHKKEEESNVSFFYLSIESIGIKDVIASTVNLDLSSNLVNFPGTAIPPNRGTSVIFGHSTLPQLFDPKNYKTIFANIHSVKPGDDIQVSSDGKIYNYKIFDISVTDAEDTSYLTQQYDGSYLTIVTCTPPGTTWKRLIIKSKAEKI